MVSHQQHPPGADDALAVHRRGVIETYVLPGCGHSVNLSRNHEQFLDVAMTWPNDALAEPSAGRNPTHTIEEIAAEIAAVTLTMSCDRAALA